jgi:2-methylcitrate dehydratase PrpD
LTFVLSTKFDVNAIKRVHVEVAQGAYDVLAGGTYGPKTVCRNKEQADHNLMHLISVALLDGEVWPEQLNEKRINPSDVQDLTKKVTASSNEAFRASLRKTLIMWAARFAALMNGVRSWTARR